jgi:hypothetical protein
VLDCSFIVFNSQISTKIRHGKSIRSLKLCWTPSQFRTLQCIPPARVIDQLGQLCKGELSKALPLNPWHLSESEIWRSSESKSSCPGRYHVSQGFILMNFGDLWVGKGNPVLVANMQRSESNVGLHVTHVKLRQHNKSSCI